MCMRGCTSVCVYVVIACFDVAFVANTPFTLLLLLLWVMLFAITQLILLLLLEQHKTHTNASTYVFKCG